MKGYVWVLLLAMASMECVASFDEGLNSYKAEDYQSALREFLPLANGGDAFAQSYLGDMYYNGNGVAQNYSQAADWYRKAADQGNVFAQYALGFMYYNGEGVSKNYSQAAYWYRKAGTQGHSDSLNNLGVGYEFGNFGVQNLVLAHIFYNLAAINGDTKSKKNRDEITPKLTPIQLSEAQELASRWVKGQPLPIITKTYPRSSKKEK